MNLYNVNMTLLPLKSSKNINLNMQRLVDVNKKRKQKNPKRPLILSN